MNVSGGLTSSGCGTRREKWAGDRTAFDPESSGRHENVLNNTGGVVVASSDLRLFFGFFWLRDMWDLRLPT